MHMICNNILSMVSGPICWCVSSLSLQSMLVLNVGGKPHKRIISKWLASASWTDTCAALFMACVHAHDAGLGRTWHEMKTTSFFTEHACTKCWLQTAYTHNKHMTCFCFQNWYVCSIFYGVCACSCCWTGQDIARDEDCFFLCKAFKYCFRTFMLVCFFLCKACLYWMLLANCINA